MKANRYKNGLIALFLPVTIAIALMGCTGSLLIVKSFPTENIIHYSQLKGWDESKSMNNYVAYMNAGDSLPLSISMNTDFLDFKQDHVDLVAKKKLYFMIKMPANLTKAEIIQLNRIDPQRLSEWSESEKKAFFKKFMLYLSTDAVHWAPLSQLKSLREIFGYNKGFISLGIMANTTDGLCAGLNLKTEP